MSRFEQNAYQTEFYFDGCIDILKDFTFAESMKRYLTDLPIKCIIKCEYKDFPEYRVTTHMNDTCALQFSARINGSAVIRFFSSFISREVHYVIVLFTANFFPD